MGAPPVAGRPPKCFSRAAGRPGTGIGGRPGTGNTIGRCPWPGCPSIQCAARGGASPRRACAGGGGSCCGSS
eukprot:8815734-Alexandrium_andersonii.AAC.1